MISNFWDELWDDLKVMDLADFLHNKVMQKSSVSKRKASKLVILLSVFLWLEVNRPLFGAFDDVRNADADHYDVFSQ